MLDVLDDCVEYLPKDAALSDGELWTALFGGGIHIDIIQLCDRVMRRVANLITTNPRRRVWFDLRRWTTRATAPPAAIIPRISATSSRLER